MTFSQAEIDLAHDLKFRGLTWIPSVGHYVWDRDHLIQHDSPFQGRVYFILELKHFLRRSDSLEHLTESMVWLPTWEQAREILHAFGVPAEDVAARLHCEAAIVSGTERLELYRMIGECLPKSGTFDV
ncbi:MAG: hypothetical protein AAGC97_15890 [Planctomycetota bacterium]